MSDLHDETPTPEPSAASPELAGPSEPETPAGASADPPAPNGAEPEPAAAAPEAPVEPETEEAASEPEAEAVAEVEAASEPEAEAVAEVEAASEPEAEVVAEPDVAAASPAETAPEPGGEAVAEAAAEAPPAAVAAAGRAEGGDAAAAGGEAAGSSEIGGAMAELEKALQEKTPVKGQVIGWNKGGYHVAVGKIAAFCPVSQIEIGNPRSPKQYLDKTFSFRVIDIQKGGRRVVLSRSDAIQAEREQRASLVRELLQPGAEVEGKVSSLTDFGAFVDLGGGIEGLIHVSELSRRRVEHPKEMLKSGQEVKVRVLKIEKGGRRISLSMKRLEPDPWKGVADRYAPGSKHTGSITRRTDFGLFVELEPGLEGLVHTSRLGLGMKLEDESLQEGSEVEVWVHEVESRRRRLALSLREVAGGNPWRGVNDRYPVGEVCKGTVERLTNFGVFIELEPGLTGLLPFSVLGSGPAGSNPRRQYHAGKEVSVRVLSIDRDRRRISLGTESSKAEGNQQDYREYMKAQRRSSSTGMNAMEAAFAKLKEQQQAR